MLDGLGEDDNEFSKILVSDDELDEVCKDKGYSKIFESVDVLDEAEEDDNKIAVSVVGLVAEVHVKQ